ncbi:MAG: tRNA epoxyqueuosine(34) reductase QueG [Betaproteobacteria bacterium]|nr:tRNA epoxyqueuosine(34) reductase QueG [Betaproteobacteria bacterium]
MRHGAPQGSRSGPAPLEGVDQPLQPQAIWLGLQADAHSLGFSQIAVADVDLSSAEPGYRAWLEAGFAGTMHYMAEHGLKRFRPAELVPGTVRVVTARMDYLPGAVKVTEGKACQLGPGVAVAPADPDPDWREREWAVLQRPECGVVSVYARGRDYHKVLRQRLARLAQGLQARIGPFGHRAFTDSAPVAEVELAQRSGLGWRGKHTLLINREGGSFFFLGELFVDLPLPLTPPISDHCGQCSACIEACPTGAIVAPYRLDARRCISYLTIEHHGAIDPSLRPLIGNRIYGCDDCQLVCPWNKYAQRSPVPDFQVRRGMQDPQLLSLWSWSETDFLRHTEGSAIRRIGYERWRRNLAVALGNGLRQSPGRSSAAWCEAARATLRAAMPEASALVREHILWALEPPGPA